MDDNTLGVDNALFYNFYVGMTWDNGRQGVLTDEGAARGLFFKNKLTDMYEGFYCTRNNVSYFNWLCESYVIDEYYWDPETSRLPVNIEKNSWWICGVED